MIHRLATSTRSTIRVKSKPLLIKYHQQRQRLPFTQEQSMEYRKLGTTDLNISLIGLGTMTWGNQNTQEEGFEQMDYALERGINFFDTAEMYAIPPSAKTYATTETISGNWDKPRRTHD